jgi:hypothetical protein
MRHDPAAGAIVIMLRSLKMYGLAQAVTDLIEHGAPSNKGHRPLKYEEGQQTNRGIVCPTIASRCCRNC